MKPSQIKFKKGSLVKQLKENVLQLAELIGKMGVASIGGAVETKQTPDGLNITVKTKNGPMSRGTFCHGADSTSLPAILPLTDIIHDQTDDATEAFLGTLSGGVLTLSKCGWYLVHYTAVLTLDVGGAASQSSPSEVSATVILRADSVELSGSTSTTSAQLLKNFDGFLTATDNDAVAVTVDVGGATGVTNAFDKVQFTLSGGGAAYGLTDVNLNGSDQSTVTLDSPQDLDVDVSGANGITVVDGSTPPSGTVTATVSGSAFFKVDRDPADSGALKIFIGATPYSPDLDVYGTSSGGTVTATNVSLSITHFS